MPGLGVSSLDYTPRRRKSNSRKTPPPTWCCERHPEYPLVQCILSTYRPTFTHLGAHRGRLDGSIIEWGD
jgi:hypothetical protein